VSQRAVFIDRDGVINHNWLNPATGQWESPIRAEDFRFRPGVIEAIARLAAHEFHLVLVSNQPNAALGKCSLADLQAVHNHFARCLTGAGITFDEFCYAYGHPKAVVAEFAGPCPERKPGPLFLLRAIERLRLNPRECWMVGDRDTDIECGRGAGVRTVQVASAEPDDRAAIDGGADFRAANLTAAVDIIMLGRDH
jgi:D-glycero-D-manno-heptose 1,7-bisphosphate phosphatase